MAFGGEITSQSNQQDGAGGINICLHSPGALEFPVVLYFDLSEPLYFDPSDPLYFDLTKPDVSKSPLSEPSS